MTCLLNPAISIESQPTFTPDTHFHLAYALLVAHSKSRILQSDVLVACPVPTGIP